MTALIIAFNIISLSQLIAFIYQLFLPNYILNILNLIYLFLEIVFFLLHFWNTPECYYIIKKRLACYPTAVSIFIY